MTYHTEPGILHRITIGAEAGVAQNHEDILDRLRLELSAANTEVIQLRAAEERVARLRSAISSLEAVDRLAAQKNDQGTTGVLALQPAPRVTMDFSAIRSVVDNVHRLVVEHAQRQPKKASEAAILVLREAGKPMHLREIISGMKAREWFDHRGYESLRGTIAGTFDRKHREADTIRKVGRGTYALREWEQTGLLAMIDKVG